MILEDKLTIEAPIERVWEALLDVQTVAACMPGVEDVRQVDDRTFDGVITAAVGPINGKFAFRAQIVESQPPTEMQAEVRGTDSVTHSSIHTVMSMRLTEEGSAATLLSYRAAVDIDGRLAILGEMLLRATAALLVQEATRRFRERLMGALASGAAKR